MTIQKTLKVDANATLTLSVRWTNTSGDPYLLSDALMQIRKLEDDEEVLLEAKVSNDTMIIEDLNNGGWATVWVPSSAMDELSYYGGAKYDVVVTRDSDGQQRRVLEGAAILSRGVTRTGVPI